ncbi:DDE-type integrase/transposase/recombinase, partial [Treponema succinifaciens]|uniref:DDE-type integrase/transposase/recombinase n=1 Tax=Treponema succinifaciens TaxID=167 RepID=UPI002A7F91BB
MSWGCLTSIFSVIVGLDQPEAPHEQWHTDISYIKVPGVFYYFISIMDGYSRKILDWALCENMEGINIELLVARVKEKYPEAKARIIHDNGKQFISKDFKSLV